MNRTPTMFARGVIYLVGIAALAVCFVLLPELAREESAGKPSDVTVPFLTISYLLATPFFIALFQSHKLLHLIDKKKAFTQQSIKTLKNIKRCAIAFSLMVIVTVIGTISAIRSIDPREEVTFIISIGFMLAFVASVLALFIAVLQKLLADAVAMKDENDLIV